MSKKAEINWTPELLNELKVERERCNGTVFKFYGHDFLIEYADYMIGWLTKKFSVAVKPKATEKNIPPTGSTIRRSRVIDTQALGRALRPSLIPRQSPVTDFFVDSAAELLWEPPVLIDENDDAF